MCGDAGRDLRSGGTLPCKENVEASRRLGHGAGLSLRIGGTQDSREPVGNMRGLLCCEHNRFWILYSLGWGHHKHWASCLAGMSGGTWASKVRLMLEDEDFSESWRQ